VLFLLQVLKTNEMIISTQKIYVIIQNMLLLYIISCVVIYETSETFFNFSSEEYNFLFPIFSTSFAMSVIAYISDVIIKRLKTSPIVKSLFLLVNVFIVTWVISIYYESSNYNEEIINQSIDMDIVMFLAIPWILVLTLFFIYIYGKNIKY
jgi:hypothetical protein